MISEWSKLEEIQPDVYRMLKNSRLKNRVAHAYLFEGGKGTGKRDAAILFAKSLFCEHIEENIEPCNRCLNCKRIQSGNHPDVHVLEPDGLSIKKEQIQTLQEEFSKKAVESNKKFYTIFHADKMTVQAANSLLKFLEEPNRESTAILVTEQVQRILPTILSRCQVISFKPLSPVHFKETLLKNGVSPHNASIISYLTQNLEEALEMNSQEWFAQAQKIMVKLYETLRNNPLKALLYLQEEWFAHFKEKEQIDRGLDLLFLIYKDLLHVQLDKRDQLVFNHLEKVLEHDALLISSQRLAEKMSVILDAKKRLLSNTNTQLLMEQLVLNLQEGSSFV
ncbi:DNA polymerase III subunit delta' [Peribacillus deserti]|uniref:DNA polymerase III subunit delta n=1 Tax=Peribacillus deserti TaxID=673318 RepID=A0A2N5M0A0_9BACI|nr:DNA polymerase III subunit delta' [Peribacillus deserti]PLT27771.1 DNA polymerase III subunit delta' [Peribacillus deserti]